jgi:hypothetical protein
MITITNPRIAGFVPRWAPFRGFTILFDNPGRSLTRVGRQLVVDGDLDADPALGFYRGLRDNLAGLGIDLLTNTYLFCPLPPPSYHVTLCDGGHQGDIGAMRPEQRHKLATLLDGLPEALTPANDLIARAMASPLVTGGRELRFRYDRLVIWSNVVLVALLAAADAESESALAALGDERRRLAAQFRQDDGFGPGGNYLPHVSLGYFANRELAQRALPCLADWERAFAGRMPGKVLPLAGASVYGFTDLVTFFKSAAA